MPTLPTAALSRRYRTHVHGQKGLVLMPGAIVEARYPDGVPSLRAMKLMCLLIAATTWKLCDSTRIHVLPLSEIYVFTHLKHDEVASLLKELRDTVMHFPVGYAGDSPFVAAPFLGEYGLSDTGPGGSAATVSYRFSEELIERLRADDRFTVLELSQVYSFRSPYGLRLWAIIAIRRRLRRPKEGFELHDIRARLGVRPGTLRVFSSFRRMALEPAISETIEHARFHCGWRPVMVGRMVARVEIWWIGLNGEKRTDEGSPSQPPGAGAAGQGSE